MENSMVNSPFTLLTAAQFLCKLQGPPAWWDPINHHGRFPNGMGVSKMGAVWEWYGSRGPIILFRPAVISSNELLTVIDSLSPDCYNSPTIIGSLKILHIDNLWKVLGFWINSPTDIYIYILYIYIIINGYGKWHHSQTIWFTYYKWWFSSSQTAIGHQLPW